jgi:hypothetical protein
MPIVTLCRSCNTIIRATIDRCAYCGSRCVDAKYLNEESIIRKDGRYQLKKESDVSSKTHSQTEET